MGRHLLIIAYAFPPNSAVGSMRPLRLVRSLAATSDWRATVIATGRPPLRSDESLLAEIPDGTRVHRVSGFEPFHRGMPPLTRPPDANRPIPRPAPATAPPPRRGAKAWLRDALSTPDDQLFWTPPVVVRALQLHLQRPFDAVMVTSPPWSAQFAGLALSKLLRIPWIADYRDPWSDIDRRHRSPAFEAWNRRLENAVVPGAGAVISTSDTYTEILRRRFPHLAPDRFVTIYNGFDETRITARSLPARRRLTLVHLGTLYETWEPWTAFVALRDWLERHPDRRDQVVLRFVGRTGPRTLSRLADLGLSELVEVTGFVEHGEAIHHCQEADALVLALGSAAGVPAGWLPSKLFEYIAYQRPILANVGEGEARRLIREAGAGWTAADDEPGVLVDALDDLWERKRNADDGIVVWRNDPERIAQLTQARLVHRWVEVLDTCCAAHHRAPRSQQAV